MNNNGPWGQWYQQYLAGMFNPLRNQLAKLPGALGSSLQQSLPPPPLAQNNQAQAAYGTGQGLLGSSAGIGGRRPPLPSRPALATGLGSGEGQAGHAANLGSSFLASTLPKQTPTPAIRAQPRAQFAPEDIQEAAFGAPGFGEGQVGYTVERESDGVKYSYTYSTAYTTNGNAFVQITGPDGTIRPLYSSDGKLIPPLLTYQEVVDASLVEGDPEAFWSELGQYFTEISQGLYEFDHEAYEKFLGAGAGNQNLPWWADPDKNEGHYFSSEQDANKYWGAKKREAKGNLRPSDYKWLGGQPKPSPPAEE